MQIYRLKQSNLELSESFQRFLDILKASFPQNWDGFHTIIVSAEIIGSAIHTSTEAHGLYSYIQRLYGTSASCSPKVITYLRRQDKVAISMLSTLARQGQITDFKAIKAIRYSLMLGAWSKLTQRREIKAVRYAKSEWRNSSLIDDFFYRIDPNLKFARQQEHEAQNASLNPQGIAILANVAARIREQSPAFDFRSSYHWKVFVKSIERSCSGHPPVPSPEELVKYMSTVEEDNRIVEQEWIDDGKPLFVSRDTKHVMLTQNKNPSADTHPLYCEILATLILNSKS